VIIVKFPSKNVSQAVLFKLLLRVVTLRTFFLNGAHFDLRKSVDISFLITYVNGRFVQWRWSESLWQKGLLCSVTEAKTSLCDELFLWAN